MFLEIGDRPTAAQEILPIWAHDSEIAAIKQPPSQQCPSTCVALACPSTDPNVARAVAREVILMLVPHAMGGMHAVPGPGLEEEGKPRSTEGRRRGPIPNTNNVTCVLREMPNPLGIICALPSSYRALAISHHCGRACGWPGVISLSKIEGLILKYERFTPHTSTK